jgi:hypothetical protein
MKMADINQMQSRIRELEARRAKGESVPELDRLYEKMDAMQNKGYTEAKKNLSGENLVKTRSTPLEEAAMEKQVAAERKKGIKSGASDRVLSAGKEALDEQRRETRGKSPDIESRAKTAYKDPYTIVESGEEQPKPKSKQQKYTELQDLLRSQEAAARGMSKEEYIRSQTKKANKMYKFEEDINSDYKKGGKVSSASKRADGCATKGKTKGKML